MARIRASAWRTSLIGRVQMALLYSPRIRMKSTLPE